MGSREQPSALERRVLPHRNKNVIFVVDATAVPPIFNQDDGQQVTGASLRVVGQIPTRWDVNLSVSTSTRAGEPEPAARATGWR